MKISNLNFLTKIIKKAYNKIHRKSLKKLKISKQQNKNIRMMILNVK